MSSLPDSHGEPDLIAGVVERRGRFRVVEPLFEPGGQIGLTRSRVQAQTGSIVLFERISGGARVIRKLGSPKRPLDVVDALLWQRLGRRGFSRKLGDAARDAAEAAASHGPRRRDLRDLATFTVDPASARDFDDAVSAQPDGDGFRLWIHIADVAAHVRPGSTLDREALRRGTSAYVPGSVEPMLPELLSADACSLAPGMERLAVTAEMRIGADGSPGSASFYRSLIRSDERLDYDQLDRVFAGTETPRAQIAEPLDLARRAAAALADRRKGGLEVDSREPEFEFDSAGDVVAARSVEQTEAHRLIEQLMIATNERVAELLERRRLPTLYRVHEQPEPERIARLLEQLASLDLPSPPLPGNLSRTEAGALAIEASRLVAAEARRRGHGREPYASLVLRSLQQASYCERNAGHAGLASTAYAHFTSPIRRYPDLVAHRALLSAVGEGEEAPDAAAVREAAVHSSERERDAMRLERTADKICACFLLERELFEGGWDRAFGGEVSGVVGAGAFVRFGGELGDVYEGFLPARRLRGERFDLNQAETALVGKRTGRSVRLGDPVGVRVESVEAPRGRVELEPTLDPDDARIRQPSGRG